jgi:hypothetical protein
MPSEGTADTSALQSEEDVREIATESKLRHPEGYRITVSEVRNAVEVGSQAAVRYAWMHLQQLQGEDPTRTPCGILEDAPTFGRRAFMLDISRCKIPTKEGFRQWLQILAGLRYNELQLYMEHSFAYTGHSDVWKKASPLAPDDISWLQQEARHLGIELVPNQNCFGHFERWIRHEPYRKYAESPDGFVTPWGDQRKVGSVLKPDDASFAFVTSLLDELLPTFDSSRVNIGCDETFELGQGATRERCTKEGMGAVYAKFVQRIIQHVETRHGMRPEFWGDIIIKHPEEINRISRKAVALCWGYEADSPFAEECAAFARSGLGFAVCPGTSSWRSFAGRTENMIANLRSATEAAFEWGAEGLVLTDWGDCGHLQQEPVSYPAMALCATLAWCGPMAGQQDAWDWCDDVAFSGRTGDTACWLEAGRVSEMTGVTPGNANLLFHWFNWPDHPLGKDVSSEKIEELITKIQSLERPVHFREQWEQTLRNLRLSLAFVQDFRQGTSTAGSLLQEAQQAHATLWRKQNRKGGLAESLERYSKPRDPNQPGYHD